MCQIVSAAHIPCERRSQIADTHRGMVFKDDPPPILLPSPLGPDALETIPLGRPATDGALAVKPGSQGIEVDGPREAEDLDNAGAGKEEGVHSGRGGGRLR